MIDTTALGELTAKAMDSIAETFEHSENVEIRTCAVIVEVDSPKSSTFWWSCSDDRPWLLKALLFETEGAIDMHQARVADERDD